MKTHFFRGLVGLEESGLDYSGNWTGRFLAEGDRLDQAALRKGIFYTLKERLGANLAAMKEDYPFDTENDGEEA
jgi:hypothetical protein